MQKFIFSTLLIASLTLTNMRSSQAGIATASLSAITKFNQGTAPGLLWGAGWFVAWKYLFTESYMIRAAFWLMILGEEQEENLGIIYSTLTEKIPGLEEAIAWELTDRLYEQWQQRENQDATVLTLTRFEIEQAFEMYDFSDQSDSIDQAVSLLK